MKTTVYQYWIQMNKQSMSKRFEEIVKKLEAIKTQTQMKT